MEANKVNHPQLSRGLLVSPEAFLAVGFDQLAFGSDRSTFKKIMAKDFIEAPNPFVTSFR